METLEFVGADYCGGGFDKKGGYDCFSMCIGFMRKQGFDLPDDYEWEGLKFNTYFQLYKKNKDEAIQRMIDFFRAHTDEITQGRMRYGDIVVMKDPNTQGTLCGIYGGGNKVLTAITGEKVMGLPLRMFKIIHTFRGRK